MSKRLFVYGTLMKAAQHERHAFLALRGRFLSNGSIQGNLFFVTTYPGAILSSAAQDTVDGEVYELEYPEESFATLDDYEECSSRFAEPTQYVRQRVQVTLPNGKAMEAWTYLYSWPVNHLKRITSGRFQALS